MIEIRPANIDVDGPALVELLRIHLTPRSDARRLDWLYRQNPHGPAAAWIAQDADKGLIIGSGAVIPRRMSVAGRLQVVGVMADFWVHPGYRTLGPALKLQRACIEGAARLGLGFFDLPQSSMPAVYRRLGVPARPSLRRLAKPLRVDGRLGGLLHSRRLGRGLAVPFNLGLSWYDHAHFGGMARQVVRGEACFGEEFTRLAEACSSHYALCGWRDAEYLQWRYGRHYYLQHQVHALRSPAGLQAYLVVVESERQAEILDLFGPPDRGLMLDLLLGAADELRHRHQTLYITVSEAHPLLPVLRAAGFVERSSQPLVAQRFDVDGRPLPEAQPWALVYGDIDF